MDVLGFLAGLLVGLSAVFCRPLIDRLLLRLRHPLGEDEQYLLRAARTGGGRLIFRKDALTAVPPQLVLREFPEAKAMACHGQVECLLARKLVEADGSGVAGRYHLTSEGWATVKPLPALPLALKRTGNWFNSVSGRAAKGPRTELKG